MRLTRHPTRPDLVRGTLAALLLFGTACASSSRTARVGVTLDTEPTGDNQGAGSSSDADDESGAEPRVPGAIAYANESPAARGSAVRAGAPNGVVRDGDYLRVPGNIVFETGRAVLRESGPTPNVLHQLREYLEAHTDLALLRIEGHTDSRGTDERNLELSGERALSVKEWLVAEGIGEERLLAVGFGPHQPIADNKTALGRAQNRRTEFVIVQYADEPRPDDVTEGGTLFE